nr:receptor-like protein Cf-9 [Coffea arabica]
MRNLIVYTLVLLSLQSREITSLSSFLPHLCHHDESLALLQLKQMFQKSTDASAYCENAYPKMISWSKTSDCCTWDGVTCHRVTGHVIGIDLSCCQLQGSIYANSSLFNLSRLQKLNLAYNDFKNSPISHGIGGLTSLTNLNLSNSNFYAQIPSQISLLSNLVSLDLSQNPIEFEHQDFQLLLQNLTQVRILSLSDVSIFSEFPKNFSSSLTIVDLGQTQVYGKLPDHIFYLAKLQQLILNGTQVTGSLPNLNCTASYMLSYLDLAYTNFSGELPNTFGCLKSLNAMLLDGCQFTGRLPESIGNLSQLTTMSLTQNSFSGPLPSVISNLVQLEVLDLTAPTWLFSLQLLTTLLLKNNLLTGQIEELNGMSLMKIDLSNNQLYGQIPKSISTLPFLDFLDLSSNNLSGVLELSSDGLEYLVLSNNRISWSTSGNVSNSLPNLYRLELSSCEMKAFPEFLRSSKKLEVLQLSDNKIQGQIPSWVTSMPWDSLLYLNLSYDHLSGMDALPWKNLRVLDVRFNQIQGQWPFFICNLKALAILDLSRNKFTGANLGVLGTFLKFLGRAAARNFGQLQVLDVGNNRLKDIFPAWLQNLTELQVLVLSSNRFFGPISIFKAKSPFQKLQIFALSCNEFSGVLSTELWKASGL